jgi:hypothetical protein
MSRAATLLSLFLLVACADAPSSDLPAIELSQPDVTIGVADGDSAYLLFGARGAARLSNGHIAVMNSGTNQIHVYDEEGRHVRTIGRRGNGPGEFNGLQRIGAIHGDTIVAYDIFLGRMTFFAPDGGVARTLPIEPFGNGVLPRAAGFTGDGRLLAHTDFNREFRRGTSRDTLLFALFDEAGMPRDTLGRYPGEEMYTLATPEAALRRPVTFGRNVFASTRDTTIAIGTNDQLTYDMFDATGGKMRSHSETVTPREVSGDEVTRADELWLASIPSPMRTGLDRHMREFPHRETYPAYDDLITGADGTIWLQDAVAPGAAARRWTVFAPDGRRIRHVTAARPLELLDVGRDYIIAWRRDDLEVEQILVFRISPS